MEKFRFTHKIQVVGWVEDTYEIEADTYEEAEQIIREASDIEDVAEFVERDTNMLLNNLTETDTREIYNELGEEIY